MKVQRCKGTQDLAPAEMTKFRRVESAFRDACLKWGYEEVRTPTLEYLHLFTSAGTLSPGMLHKVYSFLDWDGWSGERVVLRPDVTIPVARLYIDCLGDKELAKLFYVANVFRFEGTGAEARERWQCGAELIGVGSPAADAELIVVALDALKGLGIEGVELRLSHAGLVREALTRLGVSPGEQARIFDRNGGLTDIKPSGGPDGNLVALLSMKGRSSGMLKNLRTVTAPDMPELTRVMDDFIAVVDLVAGLGYEYQIDIDPGRGFEYYTGMVFQLFAGGAKIGGGGRYDALIPVLGGRNAPASGFALYVDRLMARLPQPDEKSRPRRVLVRAEATAMKEAFNIAARLHDAGYVADIDGGADSAGFRWTVDVRGQPPVFEVFDRARNVSSAVTTIGAVVALIGEQGAGQDSPA